MNSLNITIAGNPFPHMLFHWMLPFSRWETVSICFSESFASLSQGYEDAVWELGAVPGEHRTETIQELAMKMDPLRKVITSLKRRLINN